WQQRETRLILPWVIVMLILLAIALIIVISNRDQLSLRVQRSIPRHPLKRAIAFLFYNGAAGGLLWAGLLAATTLLVGAGFIHYGDKLTARFRTHSWEYFHEFTFGTASAMTYLFAYALTALF